MKEAKGQILAFGPTTGPFDGVESGGYIILIEGIVEIA
jgi:hypothetical protein